MKHIIYSHAKGVALGLRPSSRLAQSTPALTQCVGVFPDQQALNAHEGFNLQDIASSIETCSFPFPQMYVGDMFVLIFTPTRVYEYAGGTITEKLSGLTTGNRWEVVDFQNFMMATNGVVTITRSPTTHTWSVNSTLPQGTTMCEVNGQVIIGGVDCG